MSTASYKPRLIAGVVAAAVFMGALDSTVIATALPQMARSFHRPPVDLSLGITVYILVMAAFLPISTWAADRLGARSVFAAAMAGFALSSVLCGFSHDLEQFVAARVLQALTATLMTPVGNLVMLRTTEKKDLVAAIAISTTPGLVAPVLGPAVGGFIVTFLDWRWIFFLNLPIAALGVALILRFIPNLKAEERRPFDFRGFLLSGGALIALIFGLDRISASGRAWEIPAAMILAGLALGVAAVRHSLRAPHPLLPLSALRIRTFRTSALTGGTMVRTPFRAFGFILPLMFQVGLGMTAFKSGVLLLGYNGGDLLLKSIANQALRRVGFRTALIVSALLTAAATMLWVLFGPTTPFWLIFAGMAFAGMARSVLMTGNVSLTFAEVPREEIGGATVLSNVLNQTTGAVGIAMAAIVLNVSSALRGQAGHPSLQDCRIAIALMVGVGLLAVPSFLRLPHDAGAEVSGHHQGEEPAEV